MFLLLLTSGSELTAEVDSAHRTLMLLRVIEDFIVKTVLYNLQWMLLALSRTSMTE